MLEFFGVQSRNRTTDTRIFNPKDLSYQHLEYDCIKLLSDTHRLADRRNEILEPSVETVKPRFYQTEQTQTDSCRGYIASPSVPCRQATDRQKQAGANRFPREHP